LQAAVVDLDVVRFFVTFDLDV